MVQNVVDNSPSSDSSGSMPSHNIACTNTDKVHVALWRHQAVNPLRLNVITFGEM